MPTPRSRRRADGTMAWQVYFHYYDPEGKRRQSSATFDDVEQAQWWAAVIERDGIDEALRVLAARRPTGTDGVTLTDWLTRYAKRLTGIQSDSRDRYLRFIHNDIARFFGTMTVQAFTQDDDAAWIVWLEQELGNAPKTIQNKHGFLSAGMRAAVEQRPAPLIPFNPCSGIRLPRVDSPEIDVFDNEEWELFEHLLAPRWRAQAEFGLVSMARPSEIGALLVGDVDPDTGQVRITKAWKDSGTKRILGRPKSKRGVRTVNVPLESLARLDLDRAPDELLFHTATKAPITAVYFYKKAWIPALHRYDALVRGDFGPFGRQAHWSGADPEDLIGRYPRALKTLRGKRMTPYTLRHTGISWKLQDGVPMFVVSRDAGHESVTTTDRRYGHIDRRASESAALVIANRLPRVRAQMLASAA